MKLITYRDERGTAWGVVRDDGIIEGRNLFGGRVAGIRQLLAEGLTVGLAAEIKGRAATRRLEGTEFLPVVPYPAGIYCAGLNYHSHVSETGNSAPKDPRFFIRVPSSMIGHGANLIRPKASTHFDFEGELAVIIGKRGRHIAESDALDYIAGYTCFMDGSVRDWQKHTTTSGKNFHATGPLGPWMVTADEVPDPTALTLVTRLNGTEMQRSTTDLLIYTIPVMIHYLSTMTFLEPGDIIATGTPEGVGHKRNPQLWMKDGDVIEVEISSIGALRNTVTDEV